MAKTPTLWRRVFVCWFETLTQNYKNVYRFFLCWDTVKRKKTRLVHWKENSFGLLTSFCFRSGSFHPKVSVACLPESIDWDQQWQCLPEGWGRPWRTIAEAEPSKWHWKISWRQTKTLRQNKLFWFTYACYQLLTAWLFWSIARSVLNQCSAGPMVGWSSWS